MSEIGDLGATQVYVVLGENGEYSDRDVWISGVFKTQAEARAAVDAAMLARRVYDLWHVDYLRIQVIVRGGMPWDAWQQRQDEFDRLIRAELPPKPPHEAAERCSIYRVQTDRWDSQRGTEDV